MVQPQIFSHNDQFPPAIRGEEKETFAHHSVVNRLPEIGKRVLAENTFSAQIQVKLHQLIREIPRSRIRDLTDDYAPDYQEWQSYISPYLDRNWLQTPWFFAETYFYRRIMEAIDYFSPGAMQPVDPFANQKKQGLISSIEALKSVQQTIGEFSSDSHFQYLEFLLKASLWANQADLSLWPADLGSRQQSSDNQRKNENILVNDTQRVVDYLLDNASMNPRIDLILDNAGLELAFDLVLMDYLLEHGIAQEIHLHPKAHPTFVSDVTFNDIEQTLRYLSSSTSIPVRALAFRIQKAKTEQRLQVRIHNYWNSPLGGREMPIALKLDLSQSGLVISKGDANYRRWLGDRQWNFTHPFNDILYYFPTSLLALRTLKSEVAAGLSQEQIDHTRAVDHDWMINGRWGLIQYYAH